MYEKYNDCIGCGKCTQVCGFLEKYGINLKDYAQKPELAYNCFLCRECKRVCPVDIDGARISLDMREVRVSDGYKPENDGYRMLLLEKKNYVFKNYRHAKSKTVLFPGCNFPAYYPETTRKLVKLAYQKGIGVVFDCCGKPVGELGLPGDEEKILRRLDKLLHDSGVEEIIVLCPNCLYQLKGRLNVKISNIYDKLTELCEVSKVDISDGLLYLPCPDRDSKQLLSSVKKFVENDIKIADTIQCCSAGGCASLKEPDIAQRLKEEFLRLKPGKVYTYCATCSGFISKKGVDTEHILCRLLATGEKPAQGASSLINRASFKLR